MVGGEALHDTPMAKTVTVRNSKTSATDGPYAETKEQMGGFYLINAESAEEAIDIAARIPGAATGHIEVREVIDFEAPPLSSRPRLLRTYGSGMRTR